MPRTSRQPGRAFLALGLLCIIASGRLPAAAADDYPPHPDSVVQAGVSKGEMLRLTLDGSRVFPGTSREVLVYVPRQYDPARPACVYVNQDRVQWNAPVVFDNLIARGDIPVIIGVFVAPGVLKSA
ncbi:MAG: gluconolactonase, partial [Opitutaceae bacterium]